MVVYLDIIFIENIFMNYIILFGVGFLRQTKIKNLRLILSSCVASTYAVLSYIDQTKVIRTLYMKIIVSLIICKIAFKTKTLKDFSKDLILFYLVSFATGGIALAIIYIIEPNSSYNILKNEIYPIKINLIAGFIGFILIQLSFAFNKRLIKTNELICDVKIKILNHTIKVKAFVDSGNVLKDPYFNYNVIVIEKEILEKELHLKLDYETLTKEYMENLNNKYNKHDSERGNKSNIYNKSKNNKENEIYNETKMIKPIKPILIPFHSIGSANSTLIGIKPESVEIENFNGKTINLNNIILGLYDKKINQYYSALIGLNLLESERQI